MKISLADVKAGFSWLAKQKGFASWKMALALDSEDGTPIRYALKFIGELEAGDKSMIGYAYDSGRDGGGWLRLTTPTGPALWECNIDINKSVSQLHMFPPFRIFTGWFRPNRVNKSCSALYNKHVNPNIKKL